MLKKTKEYQALYVGSGRDEFLAHKRLYSYSYNLRIYLTNGSDANHCVFTLCKSKKWPYFSLLVFFHICMTTTKVAKAYKSSNINLKITARYSALWKRIVFYILIIQNSNIQMESKSRCRWSWKPSSDENHVSGCQDEELHIQGKFLGSQTALFWQLKKSHHIRKASNATRTRAATHPLFVCAIPQADTWMPSKLSAVCTICICGSPSILMLSFNGHQNDHVANHLIVGCLHSHSRLS